MAGTQQRIGGGKLGLGLALTAGGLGLAAYLKNKQMAEEDPDIVETTLDGLEKYVLDPIGDNVSPTAALTAAGLTAAGIGAHKGYKAYQERTTKRKK